MKIHRRIAVLTISALLPLGLGACGNKEQHPTRADGEALYVDAGPLTYQVQLSRELNPFAVEDKGYLAGIAPTDQTVSPNQIWFAVWLWAKNFSKQSHATANQFDIVDSQGHKYAPVSLNSSQNPFAWQQLTIQPQGTDPATDSVQQYSSTQGGELLFKLDNTVYDNRPLTLEIYAPGQTSDPSTVSLDL